MSIFKEVDLVVFDLDGTFYPQKKVKAALIKKCVFQLRKLSRYQKARHALVGSEFESFEDLIKNTSDLMHDQTGKWIEQKFYPAFLSSFDQLDKHPLVNQVLIGLKNSGKKIAVVSDYGHVSERLHKLGINPDQFDFLLGTETHGLLKPNSKIVDLILKAIPVDINKVLFIGDRVDTDQAIAVNSGAQFLGIHFETPKTDQFYTWEELNNMI